MDPEVESFSCFCAFFSPLNGDFDFIFVGPSRYRLCVCDGNTEVNLPKSSLKGNKTALNSLSCIFLFLDLPNTTDFLCGASHTKTVTYHILLCIGNIFFFLALSRSSPGGNYVATCCRFPPLLGVQWDSFTFATGNLHILHICLGANTLTCKVSVT